MNMGSYSCYLRSNVKAKEVASLSSFLKLVSEESKLKLLCILRQGEHCVCEIMENVKMSQSLISHHLSDLKKADIVVDDKRGLRVYYSLTDKGKHIVNLLFQFPREGVKR